MSKNLISPMIPHDIEAPFFEDDEKAIDWVEYHMLQLTQVLQMFLNQGYKTHHLQDYFTRTQQTLLNTIRSVNNPHRLHRLRPFVLYMKGVFDQVIELPYQ